MEKGKIFKIGLVHKKPRIRFDWVHFNTGKTSCKGFFKKFYLIRLVIEQ